MSKLSTPTWLQKRKINSMIAKLGPYLAPYSAENDVRYSVRELKQEHLVIQLSLLLTQFQFSDEQLVKLWNKNYPRLNEWIKTEQHLPEVILDDIINSYQITNINKTSGLLVNSDYEHIIRHLTVNKIQLTNYMFLSPVARPENLNIKRTYSDDVFNIILWAKENAVRLTFYQTGRLTTEQIVRAYRSECKQKYPDDMIKDFLYSRLIKTSEFLVSSTNVTFATLKDGKFPENIVVGICDKMLQIQNEHQKKTFTNSSADIRQKGRYIKACGFYVD